MIQERYCSYEVSRLLKEKGFNEPCRSYYISSSGRYSRCLIEKKINNCEDNEILRPTHQMACDWLSETYHIEISIEPKGIREVGDNQYKNCYSAIVYKPNKANIIGWNSEHIRIVNMLKKSNEDSDEFDTKEEAIDEALKFSLKYLI